MNRSELVDAVGTATGLDKHQSEGAVKALVDVVVSEIKAGAKVQIFGFGTFTPTSRAARVGRNPQTGEAVNIAASTGVRFAPAAALKAALNPKPAKKASASASASAKKASASASAKKTSASASASAKPAKDAKPAKAAKAAKKATKKK